MPLWGSSAPQKGKKWAPAASRRERCCSCPRPTGQEWTHLRLMVSVGNFVLGACSLSFCLSNQGKEKFFLSHLWKEKSYTLVWINFALPCFVLHRMLTSWREPSARACGVGEEKVGRGAGVAVLKRVPQPARTAFTTVSDPSPTVWEVTFPESTSSFVSHVALTCPLWWDLGKSVTWQLIGSLGQLKNEWN